MSELKVYHCNEWHNEYTEFYIKYEADKVIADLEESHKKEVEQLLMEILKLKDNLKETREWLIESQRLHKRCADNAIKIISHQKYKRCRAMAKRCRDLWILFRYFGKGGNPVFYWRWWNIWLKIADKFKEAK